MFNKFCLTICVLAWGVFANAAEIEIDNLKCEGFESLQGSTSLRSLIKANYIKIDTESTTASVKWLHTDLIKESEERFGLIPSVNVWSFSAQDVTNSPYQGRKYKGFYKLNLISSKSRQQGSAPEKANLILSPEYKVVHSEERHNRWNPDRKRTIEVRKHPAVLDFSLNDHQGDYLPLDCFSVEVFR